MKKLMLGTITAATIIASATAASAQVRSDRGWYDNSHATQQGQIWQDPNKNFAPDYVK